MAGVDVVDAYCVAAAKSDDSVTKGLIIEGSYSIHVNHCCGLATELTSSRVPDSDVAVSVGPTCKEFPIG